MSHKISIEQAQAEGQAIEQFDRAQYEADEEIRRHDSIDDMDDYRPQLYTGATSKKLSSREISARRRARRRF